MKYVLFTLIVAFLGCQYASEPSVSMVMCHDPNEAIAEFASFANDGNFRDAHPAPAPVPAFNGGKMVEFPITGGPNGKGFLITAKKKTNRYLLLFHEWWGLNDYIKSEAAMWSAELGVNVLAVDLYDGKVATNADDAGKLMQANDAGRSQAIILGAGKFLGENAVFQTMGWCFGGGWSLQAALLLQNKVKACVIYYGMPEKNLDKLKTLRCNVMMVHATQDQWINDAVVKEFQDNMARINKKLQVEKFDANHAFANPSSPRYNEAKAKEARGFVKAFLKKNK